MRTEELLFIARETIAKVPLCFAITASHDGEANARIVQPSRLREDWTVQFMTSRHCRKVREMAHAGRLTLAYAYDPESAYVALIGRPDIIGDVPAKRAAWKPDSYRWFPGGPEDPSVVLVHLNVDRIELFSGRLGVMPAPEGLSAAVLTRDGQGWRYSTSSQSEA